MKYIFKKYEFETQELAPKGNNINNIII